MASMNNWLGFSLSPQDHQHPQIGNFTSDEISTAQISGESCFHLPSDSPIPSLNLPAPPFGIIEAFNRNNNHSQGVMIRKITAARAYDLAAMKYWGTTTTTNFPMSNYEKEIEEMKHMTRQEYVASLRRCRSLRHRRDQIPRPKRRYDVKSILESTTLV